MFHHAITIVHATISTYFPNKHRSQYKYICFCNMLFQAKCMWAYVYFVHIIPNMIKRIKVQANTKISLLPYSRFPSNSIPNNNNDVDIVKGKKNGKKWRTNEQTEPNSVNIDIISSKMMLFFFRQLCRYRQTECWLLTRMFSI